MKFLVDYTIDLKLVPKYTKFNGVFNEDLDRHLLDVLVKSDGCSNSIKKQVTKAIVSGLHGNNTHIHNTEYRQSYGIGRYYGNTITNFPKIIKHTLFSHLGWCDADMVKGHPSLILQLAKKNGDISKYPSIAEYVNNPEHQFNEMTKHYGANLLEHQKKWLFNSMIYGGGYDSWVNALIDPPEKDLKLGYTAVSLLTHEARPFETAFKKECDAIKEIIFKTNPTLVELLKTPDANKKYFNGKDIHTTGDDTQDDAVELPLYKLKNRVVSYYLQILENECLYHLYEFLVKDGYMIPKNCSLEKDGICFKPAKEIDFGLADSMNDYTFKKTSFHIKWKIKPYESCNVDSVSIGVRKQWLPDKTENTAMAFTDDNARYEAMKTEFELTHMKMKGRNAYIIVDVDDNYKTDIVKENTLIPSYRHLSYGYNKKRTDVGMIIDEASPISFIDRWVRDKNIYTVDRAEQYPPPLSVPTNHYNLWTPFPFQLLTDEYDPRNTELEEVLAFIRILCNNDDVSYNYFIKWLAHLLQFPAQKTGLFPILISAEGVGKGTLMEIIKKMVGKDKFFETTNPEETVWGNFNPLMKNAYLVYVNEFAKKNQAEAEGRIKGLLTDTTININGKGKDPFQMASYHRFIGSTNNEDPTNVKAGDRRKWIVRCSDELKGNKEAFVRLYELKNDDLVMRTLFDYLMTVKCDDIIGTDPPKTDYQITLEESNEPIMQQFLKWSIGDIIEHESDKEVTTTNVKSVCYTAHQLGSKFQRFCKEVRLTSYDCSDLSVVKKLSVYATNLPTGLIVKNAGRSVRTTCINWLLVRKHFGFVAEVDDSDSEEE